MPKADILIVDDTPTNLSLLTKMLTGNGYAVRAVTNGLRALESVQALPPDLILLDIRMPGLTGFQVCEQLKADMQTHEIPVIFISALDDIQDKIRGFNAGGVDYITKPFQLEEVLARTETHLNMRRLQRQLQEANRKMAAELRLAGQMQANFMPSRLPNPPGWNLTAHLQPARETSGDFFDEFNLPDGRLVVLIADVVDKGVGAALFMAYVWSIIRTYADEYPSDPPLVFNLVNRRILTDTGTNQFVTLFYGVIDPASGKMVYSNAGHLPPLHFCIGQKSQPDRLLRTGMPLGIFDDQEWQKHSINLARGDLLVLYTDGITDAVDAQEKNFGEKRLAAAVKNDLNKPLRTIQEKIFSAVEEFTRDVQQFDDMALVLVSRSK